MKCNYWKIGFLIHALLPFGFIFSLAIFYIHATAILGYYPKYNSPDPKNLDFYNTYSFLINNTIAFWMVSFTITIPLILTYLIIKRKKSNWKLICFSLGSQTIALLLFFSDILEWFVD